MKHRFVNRVPKRLKVAASAVVIPLLLWSTSCLAQRPSADPAPRTSGVAIPSGIAWYGVLKDGLAEAKESNRPILLLSAAPQCAGIPGMW